MKILFYASETGPFLYPETLLGLREALGRKNVSTHVPNGKGHDSESDIMDRMDDFDGIIMHCTAFRDRGFERVLNKKTSAVKIFFDSFDDFFVRRIYNHPEIKYYMKRELYNVAPSQPYIIRWGLRHLYDLTVNAALTHNFELPSRWELPAGFASKAKHNKLRPFPLTVVPEKIKPAANRVYDVSFIGHLTSPDRSTYTQALRDTCDEYELKCKIITSRSHPNMMSKAEHARFMVRSKAGLSVRGVGCDTIRYWEMPAYGTALLSQRIPLIIPNNFIDNESALFFDSSEELKKKIERYIVKSDEWREIARNGQRRFLKYHTPEKRAENLILNLIK